MKLETFFEKFELFADVPNAVGKMRELVLELAIQGLLVEQSTDDIQAQDSLRESTKAVWPLTLNKDVPVPAGWAAIPLGCAIASNTGGGTPSKQNRTYWNGAIPWASVKDIQSEKYLTRTIDSITEEGLRNSSSNLIPPNRLLVVTRMGLGKLAINKMPVAINQDLRAIEPNEALDLDFAYLLFKALKLIGKGVTVKGVTLDVLHSMPVALPPLAEQKRIVAKVDELMALCDRLEAQQQERDTRHAALARASLSRFAEAPIPANLDFLFHKSYTITPADLCKSILTLAVQGLLVPQDPSDKSASKLVDQIRNDANGQRKSQRGVSRDSTDDEKPYGLPATWVWARAEELTQPNQNITYGILKPVWVESGVPTVRVTEMKTGAIDINALPKCTAERAAKFSKTMLGADDLLISKDGTIGKTAFVPPELVGGNITQHVLRFAISKRLDRHFVRICIDAPPCQAWMAGETKGVALQGVNVGDFRRMPLPIPPLAEQRRIVAKVDQLMALVDQLETQLSEARIKSAALLDAVIHELLNPTPEIVDLASYRAVVGCYAISKMQGKRYFGRTAAMKVLYLAEAHVGLELGLKPMREAAGPFDSWLYRFEEQGEREAWFKVVDDTTAGGKKKIEYRPGQALAEQSAQAERLFTADQRKEFDRLLALFSDRTTEEAEIIATLFAAWNDFLIDGHEPSDDEIVREVRENWHEKKERFTPALLRKWLGWLRQNDVVPNGRTPRTMHQTQLLLN